MKSIITRSVIGAALACASVTTAIAQDTPPEDTGVSTWDLFHGAPKFKDENGNTLKVRGRILFDVANFEESKGGISQDFTETEFRAARLGFEGQYDNVKFKAELDFAGDDISVKDMLATYKGSAVDVTVGQFKTPNSLNETTSSRHTTFMERAAFTDAFGLDRRLGVAVGKGGDNYSWKAGVFRNSINSFNDDNTANTIFAARGTYALKPVDGGVVHLGASYRYTDEENSGQPKRSSRWGAHLANEKVKPQIGAEASLFGFEAAMVQGPFHAQAEYMTEDGSKGDANGYYLSGGFFLTGESRKYKASSGAFDRTKPANPISKGGMGGWEVAARYDAIDATSASDEESSAWTAGLIWYPESHLRFKLEYITADADTYDANGIQLRTQIDW